MITIPAGATMSDKKAAKVLFRLLLIVFTTCMCACARPDEPKAEEPPPPRVEPQASRQPAPAQTEQDHEPPGLAEVEGKIKEVFKGAVILDSSRGKSIVAGDFNGDASQDLAVVVRPVEAMIEEINSEFASWMLGDPLTAALPAPIMIAQSPHLRPAPVRVAKEDVLLAIIHGYGQDGWRNPEATQAYLLRNTAGNNIKYKTAEEVLKEGAGNKKLPPLHGDVLSERIGSYSGFIYYTGVRYAWYSPELYKAGPPARRAH
jgi:hypothetical protein